MPVSYQLVNSTQLLKLKKMWRSKQVFDFNWSCGKRFGNTNTYYSAIPL